VDAETPEGRKSLFVKKAPFRQFGGWALSRGSRDVRSVVSGRISKGKRKRSEMGSLWKKKERWAPETRGTRGEEITRVGVKEKRGK